MTRSEDTLPPTGPKPPRPSRHTFSQPDLIIAATAFHHGLTVVTRNVSDLRARSFSGVQPLGRSVAGNHRMTTARDWPLQPFLVKSFITCAQRLISLETAPPYSFAIDETPDTKGPISMLFPMKSIRIRVGSFFRNLGCTSASTCCIKSARSLRSIFPSISTTRSIALSLARAGRFLFGQPMPGLRIPGPPAW